MARLIDATRIEQYILNNCSDNEEINAIYAEIINAPTMDAVRCGRWKGKEDQKWHCSECDGIAPKGYRYNYCPHCGAKMTR